MNKAVEEHEQRLEEKIVGEQPAQRPIATQTDVLSKPRTTHSLQKPMLMNDEREIEGRGHEIDC